MRLIRSRKLSDYRVQLLIVQNPHTKNPKELWEELQDDEILPSDPMNREYDEEAVEAFKNKLSSSGRILVK